MTLGTGLALAYHLISRLAYVGGVGVILAGQAQDRYLTRLEGVAGFRKFRHFAATMMTNDAASFVLLAVLSAGTMPSHTAGIVLVVLGIGVKLWARAGLGPSAYYWGDFFFAGPPRPMPARGPYRFVRNPMYTLGYFQAYGIALALGSLPALLAAAFDQAAILVFHALVEAPHYARVSASTPPRSAG